MTWMHRSVLWAGMGLLAVAATVQAETPPPVGWVEHAWIQDLPARAKAKLDTGALTSSLHATDVKVIRQGGERRVQFQVTLTDAESGSAVTRSFERPLVREVTIRGAGGKVNRYVVHLDLCLGGQWYTEQFTLEDRSDMIYPLLLGRRTLQHLPPVDVTRTFTREQSACTADSPRYQGSPDADTILDRPA